MAEFLNEKRLGEFLKLLFPKHEFIHDRIVPNSSSRRRPDYRNDDLKIIVEFDGDKHYKEVSKIKSERNKTENYQNMGYRVIRVPYFIQLTPETISHLFGVEKNYTNGYPHGFIDKKASLPADYCEIGIRKFENDLNRFSFLKKEIVESLKEKAKLLGDKDLVLPPSLQYILE